MKTHEETDMFLSLYEDRDLHVHVLGRQREVLQAVVPRCVSVGVQASGEVTAGHGDAHNAIADAWHNTETQKPSSSGHQRTISKERR